MGKIRESLGLLAREAVFRAVCRHRQGSRPNILLYCSRRGGSTWVLNTIASHPGLRYVGRPFLTVLLSRWRKRMPDLAEAADFVGDHLFRQIIHFEGEKETRFRALSRDIIESRIHIYPSLAFRAPYFNRVTDRIIFQMTSGGPLIKWFDEHFDVSTVVMFRHPISTGISIQRSGWPHECLDFLHHRWFVQTHLTSEQLDLAWKVVHDGSPLAQHVLDWTLKTLVPYRALESGDHQNWLTMTYEQIATDPEQVLQTISQRLDLPDIETMSKQLRLPSRTVTPETAEQVNNPDYLLSRWREKVDSDEEQRLLAIPQAFGIDIYRPGQDIAAERFQL